MQQVINEYIICHNNIFMFFTFPFSDMLTCGCRQEMSIYWKLHICPQCGGERPVDLYER